MVGCVNHDDDPAGPWCYTAGGNRCGGAIPLWGNVAYRYCNETLERINVEATSEVESPSATGTGRCDIVDVTEENVFDIVQGTSEFCQCGVCRTVFLNRYQVSPSSEFGSGLEGVLLSLPSLVSISSERSTVLHIWHVVLAPGVHSTGQLEYLEADFSGVLIITGNRASSGVLYPDAEVLLVELVLTESVWNIGQDIQVQTFTSCLSHCFECMNLLRIPEYMN